MEILFSSLACQLDPASGAARSVGCMLQAMAARGIGCATFTSSIFDAESGVSPAARLRELGAKRLPKSTAANLWLRQINGLDNFITPASVTRRESLSLDEEKRLLIEAVTFMRMVRPQVLITYGSGYFERALLKLARDAGIKTAFYLANPTYVEGEVFQHVDLVVTDTQATAALYRQRLGLDLKVIGKFVDRPSMVGLQATHDHVTLINPAPEKGGLLFHKIVELAHLQGLKIPFLVVESRCTLKQLEDFTSVSFADFEGITTCAATPDIAPILAQTQILLLPSLWHESGARSILEACSLGIPVIASDRGGSAELLGGAGILLPVSDRLANDYLAPPTNADAAPWLEAIMRLRDSRDGYDAYALAAQERWRALQGPERVDALIRLLLNRTV